VKALLGNRNLNEALERQADKKGRNRYRDCWRGCQY
jgi:hypothetical protein